MITWGEYYLAHLDNICKHHPTAGLSNFNLSMQNVLQSQREYKLYVGIHVILTKWEILPLCSHYYYKKRINLCDPLFFMQKFCDPSFFMTPYSLEENDSPGPCVRKFGIALKATRVAT